MRRSVLALSAAMIVIAIAQRDAAAQLLCEQPGCTTYPSDSISNGGIDPMDDSQVPQFAVDEQFGSFGGDSFVSTDATIIGDFIGPRTILRGRSFTAPGATSRFKLAENQSPIPRNRVFYNFSHFHNSVDDGVGSNFNINRHTFGLEKTFLNGMTSAEIRIPFASTVGATQIVAAGQPFTEATEFGDIGWAGKVLLINGPIVQVSGGIAGSLPTAPDLEVIENNNMSRIENEAFHLGPFIGVVVRPGSRLTISGVVQMDFDLNGNGFYDVQGGLQSMGQIQDQNLFLASVSAAYWMRQGQNQNLISDIAGIVELHFSTSTVEGDFIVPTGYSPYDRANAIIATEGSTTNILNLTGGVDLRMGPQNSIVIGAGVPLRSDAVQDSLFDTEIIFQFNRFY